MPSTKKKSDPDRDVLTGLPAGRGARDVLARGFQDALARGDAVSVGVVDVDEFRDANRLLGVERADQLLKAVAKRVAQALPEGAPLVRLAGDTFAVLLAGKEPEEALLVLQGVRAAVAKSPVVVGLKATRRETHPTISAGVASGPRDGDSFEVVLARAHSAVRRAKSLGRDRVAGPPEDKMILKSSYYPATQLERLKSLAAGQDVAEAVLLREALEDLLLKYKDRRPS